VGEPQDDSHSEHTSSQARPVETGYWPRPLTKPSNQTTNQ